MFFIKFIFFVLAAFQTTQAIKVNMQGSLTLGKDVVDVVKNIIELQPSGRRSLSDKKLNKIMITVETAFICKDLNIICKPGMDMFLNDYFVTILKAIESLFEELVKSQGSTTKTVIFESELKNIIDEIKKLMVTINDMATEKSITFYWINILKRINALCQIKAISFTNDRIEGDSEIEIVKKKFVEKLTITLSGIELHYEKKLCKKHEICIKRHDCSKALHDLLARLIALDESKNKAFVNDFIAALDGTKFYTKLKEDTANEFQTVLSEISLSQNISAKSLMNTVFEIVNERVQDYKVNGSKSAGPDVKLLHIILSDLDHTYSRHKRGPFKEFMVEVDSWAVSDKKLSAKMQQVMRDITKVLSFETDDVIAKLINEVRTFLALTVEP